MALASAAMTEQGSGPAAARPRWRRTLLISAALMAAAYAAIYFPYPADSLPGRLLSRYVELQAALAGALIRLFDDTARVQGHNITGRFPLVIVMDCAALDAKALFLAAVLAFPAPWRRKLLSAAAGLAAIAAVNALRIVTLHLVGRYRPQAFELMHEEVLQLAIVASAVAAFALWVRWTQRPREVPARAPA